MMAEDMEHVTIPPAHEVPVKRPSLKIVEPSSTTSTPKAPSPRASSSTTEYSSLAPKEKRRPPTLPESLFNTALLFPPLQSPDPNLLPYLPSSLILPARVTSTTLAHTTNLHIRSSTLLLHDTSCAEYHAALRLPPQSISTNKGVITISAIGRSPLHIRPSEGSIGPLLEALRPSVPPVTTIINRLSNRVFTARLKYRKVALKLFRADDDFPHHAISTRAGLQRARGIGVVPMLAGIQGRGYCGIVMPIYVDLGTYVDKFGKLDVVNGRAVIAQLVQGVCRVHELGCEVGEFRKGDVLLHPRGAMVARIGHAQVLHGVENDRCGEWKDTLTSLVSIVRECCDVDEGGEDFVNGCERLWSTREMKSHSWVKEAVIPRLRKFRVKGSKDIMGVPRRIGPGGNGILGWEYYGK